MRPCRSKCVATAHEFDPRRFHGYKEPWHADPALVGLPHPVVCCNSNNLSQHAPHVMVRDTGTPSPQSPSWLFIKGEETVWILRPEDFVLLVYGPGSEQRRHTFDGEVAMEGFHVWLAEQLMSSGWILWGIDRDRRNGGDRRGTTRGVPDRRVTIQDQSMLRANRAAGSSG